MLKGIAAGAAITVVVIVAAVVAGPMVLAPEAAIAERIGFALQADAFIALWLAVSIGLLAKHRFFTPEDIDGGGLTRGTEAASILQATLQNTLEQAVVAVLAHLAWAVLLPASWMFAIPAAVVLFLCGRVLFVRGYRAGAPARALGFALTFYPSVLMLVLAVGAAVGMLMSTGAAAASFPCEKAQTSIEKAICADAEVSDLDEYLGRYYSAARSALGRAGNCMRADQQQWLREVRNACADAACLKKAYLERLGALDALQPGATALRNIELPRVPALAWIIPPAEDKVAAPPKPAAKPLEARGQVVNEVATGDGFVLRTAEGATHILMLSMLLDSPSDVHLESFAKAGATFLARGHEAKDPRGNVYFEPSRCVFLYRLP